MSQRDCVCVCVCIRVSVGKQECLKTRYQVQTPNPLPHPLRKYKSHGILHSWLIVSISQMFHCFIFLPPFLALAVLFPTFLLLLLCVCLSLALFFISSVLSFLFLSLSSVPPPSNPSTLLPPPLADRLIPDVAKLYPHSLLLFFCVNSSSSSPFLLSTLSTVEPTVTL